MKNLLIACGVLMMSTAYAQKPPPRTDELRDEIQAMKIGFLTQRLDLTPEEAQKFWPVYNKFQDERSALRQARKDNRMKMGADLEGMSEADVEKLVDGEIAFRQKDLDLLKKYHGEFKKVLPIRKVGLLYRSEEEFKRELLQRLRERRRPEPDRPRRGQ